MGQEESSVDQLYVIAENLAQEFSLFPQRGTASVLQGTLTEEQIEEKLEQLRDMDVDSYIEAVVKPVEESGRPGSKEIIRALDQKILREEEDGPLYVAELEMDFGGKSRRVGFITQNRKYVNGKWGPSHHQQAAKAASEFAIRSIPIVSLMDTPGADEKEEANANNQAHSISALIAEMCNVDVPTIGIVVGQGYSGGAIPLAASNLLLSLRTGVFSTIHPRGLASLVRRYNLSWQECAKFVGLSPYELYKQGNIDGIIDYEPGESDKVVNLKNVITSGILFIEENTEEFVREHPEIMDHYERNLKRHLSPSEFLGEVHTNSSLKLRSSPTEYPNLFGVTYRYLRYLGLRKRIRSTSTTQYGHLAAGELPKGELKDRVFKERRAAFLGWLQDPDKIIYEEVLNKSWKNFKEKKSEIDAERGRIAQLIFGEPKRNFDNSVSDLCMVSGLHLYNRWKASTRDNLTALINYLKDVDNNVYLLRPADVRDVDGLLNEIITGESNFAHHLKSKFSHEAKKLFDADFVGQKTQDYIKGLLVSELNMIIEGDPLHTMDIPDIKISDTTRTFLTESGAEANTIQVNRRILEDNLWTFLERRSEQRDEGDDQNHTILDVVFNEEIRECFIEECRNLIIFNLLYEGLLDDLVSIARQANESHTLPEDFISQLIDGAIVEASAMDVFHGKSEEDIGDTFAEWLEAMTAHSQCSNFLKSVEEWIKMVHPEKSDTLFVIMSFFFEKLLPEYYSSHKTGKRYEGRINPLRIGRRKDFWNRLTIAYRDLLFNEILTKEKRAYSTNHHTILSKFFSNFEERYANLMTADPISFPSLRPSIEAALKKNITPCGLITGIGEFATESSSYKMGVVLSNLEFQVGSIDGASCEKFCRLLVECAEQRLPVICFISSGGMQTKEGACSLFSMPVINDRITRFVRDNDLPIIMFGFGDCTGGAQASFVTHPLVQTYYFTGTSMPFAGQTVVESNLPFTCLLSNYLSTTPGAMRGLVRHPFATEMDVALRKVDAEIPLPTESVEQVVERIMSGTLTPLAPVVVQEQAQGEEDQIRPVKKILIHARGCTAVKLVQKSLEHGLEVVLVQSDPDMDSVAAEMVASSGKDTVVCIGGNTSDESYLNALSVVRIAKTEQVDSLHPGIGFLSEDPNFAKLVRDHQINFIGPKVSSMETMGNKSNAINTTLSIGVPVVPGSHGIVTNSEIAAEISEEIGYPILLKAVHGGGGKGIQVVEKPEQLHSLFTQVTTEAKAAFGNGDVYIEKYVISLRHIEVQILRDTHSNISVLGLRDCSVQRNNQKLMEESGSTLLPDNLKAKVLEYAEKISNAVDYIGAGTVEFIYDVANDTVYFMEMNTRLQVEHPVTEVVTGIDIVKKQFDIASGESIKELCVEERGYGLEIRVNAEKAVLDAEGTVSFVPTPGKVNTCVLPEQDHIQLISTIGEGKTVSPFYDSLVVQIIAWGTDRVDAVNKMCAYLESVVIHGICTNISLVKGILRDQEFLDGKYDTTFLPRYLARIDKNKLINEIEEASGSAGLGLDLDTLKIEGSEELKVLSPSTGVFYLTPSPSEPEYVNVGDVISTEDTICQMEAMKMFTPVNLNSFSGDTGVIYSPEKRYKVTRINHISGQQVNEGDLLFVIEPLEEAA